MARRQAPRPHYFWGTLCAAFLAKHLGYERISVIEFGVAGGNGLLELERIAEEIEPHARLEIEVYGFDTGTGLPNPKDYRDLPQLWSEGFFGMDEERLRARLDRAQLLIGPVAETITTFLASSPAPVGFVSFDLDMYSSTMDALQLFEADEQILLPRVHSYFDDIIGFSHSDFNGERLAIEDFNRAHETRKLSRIYGMRYFLRHDAPWTEMTYLMHAFDHSRYNDFDGSHWMREFPLTD